MYHNVKVACDNFNNKRIDDDGDEQGRKKIQIHRFWFRFIELVAREG